MGAQTRSGELGGDEVQLLAQQRGGLSGPHAVRLRRPDPTVPPKLDCHNGGEPVGLGPGWEVGGECRGLASGLGVMGPLDPGSAARVVPTCACVPAPWPRPTPPEWRYKQVLV